MDMLPQPVSERGSSSYRQVPPDPEAGTLFTGGSMIPQARLDAVLFAVCVYGLHQHPSELPAMDLNEQREHIHRLLRRQAGVPTRELVEAARFGMKTVFPHSQDGYFDAYAFSKSIIKAKAAAAKMRRTGQIPMSADEAHRIKDARRRAEEHTDEREV